MILSTHVAFTPCICNSKNSVSIALTPLQLSLLPMSLNSQLYLGLKIPRPNYCSLPCLESDSLSLFNLCVKKRNLSICQVQNNWDWLFHGHVPFLCLSVSQNLSSVLSAPLLFDSKNHRFVSSWGNNKQLYCWTCIFFT